MRFFAGAEGLSEGAAAEACTFQNARTAAAPSKAPSTTPASKNPSEAAKQLQGVAGDWCRKAACSTSF